MSNTNERAKVGESRFESWYGETKIQQMGTKQRYREAYEAGLNEAQQVAAPVEMTGDQIIEWMRQRGLEQLDAENQALCVRLIRAYEENPKIGTKP